MAVEGEGQMDIQVIAPEEAPGRRDATDAPGFRELVKRMRSRTSEISPEEIDADAAAAKREVRQARRARRS